MPQPFLARICVSDHSILNAGGDGVHDSSPQVLARSHLSCSSHGREARLFYQGQNNDHL